MPATVRQGAVNVKRVVFREVVEGDFRKFQARSNDADTGGGARDLRFSPYDAFIPIFEKLFPHIRTVLRSRGGGKLPVDIRVGGFWWEDPHGKVLTMEATFEPPTDPRPTEGRVPVVYKYPPFSEYKPPTDEGRCVVLLIQREDDSVWPAFATETELRNGLWQKDVTSIILRSLDAKRSVGQVARGYKDFTNGQEYSDAF